MLTYELKKAPGLPLYEALYRHLRRDIQTGVLPAGEKLPSKRALAENLKVSRITVETAYNQLLSEGYIRSTEKVGYFVEAVAQRRTDTKPLPTYPPEAGESLLDLTANGPARFPFSVWNKLQREVLQDYGQQLLQNIPHAGSFQLRAAIAQHLWDFRGMAADPDNIIIGAGTDFLYNLLIQLLGRDRVYAVEDPGYDKIRKIYAAGGVPCVSAPMDGDGVIPELLESAGVLHISPSHHFPTGIVTPLKRRAALLDWAANRDGYIIEDDYDSEFRFRSHPVAALQTLDKAGRVIYMNSFSKTLAPSIRISYMVLPTGLMQRFRETLGFYSCTVSSFEQYTLARFLSRGYFEKHINRMRKFYKSRRDRVLAALESCPCSGRFSVLEEDAGLHFLVKVETALSDEALTARFREAGIRVRCLSSYYTGTVPENQRSFLVINYSGLDEAMLDRLNTLYL
jgi:GntR family transcriptional regulator/MocR family aminotransferase